MKVVRVEERVVTAWKNGRGWTTTLAISPPSANLESFDWRISIAGTDQGGPFSSFPGIDRTLLLLAGRVRLSIGNQGPVILDPESPPVVFAGDFLTVAELLGDAIVDFNVMTRRSRFTQSVIRKTIAVSESFESSSANTVLALNGAVNVQTGDAESTINPGDIAVIYGDSGKVRITPGGISVIIWVTITAVGD